MQAIREIHTIYSDTLTLRIPSELLGQRLEVILLPTSEPSSHAEAEISKASLLKVLASLEPCEEAFPDIDEALLPLDDVDLF